MENLRALEEIFETLQMNGYDVELVDEAVRIAHGGHFGLLTISDGQLVVTSHLCNVAEVPDELDEALPMALLKANAQTRPFAFELLDGETEAESYYVLADSVPLGDLCSDELNASMDALGVALATADQYFDFLNNTDEGEV